MHQFKWTTGVAGAAVLTAAVALGAAAQGAKASPAGASQPAPAKASEQRGQRAAGRQAARVEALSGTIAAYDASANTVTIKTASGEQTVSIAANTRIREGSKTLKASELSGLTGRNVKVRYRESSGKLVADSITIAPAGK